MEKQYVLIDFDSFVDLPATYALSNGCFPDKNEMQNRKQKWKFGTLNLKPKTKNIQSYIALTILGESLMLGAQMNQIDIYVACKSSYQKSILSNLRFIKIVKMRYTLSSMVALAKKVWFGSFITSDLKLLELINQVTQHTEVIIYKLPWDEKLCIDKYDMIVGKLTINSMCKVLTLGFPKGENNEDTDSSY